MNTAVLPAPVGLRRRPVSFGSRARGTGRDTNHILILGRAPIATDILHEIGRRPDCRWSVIGVVDDPDATAYGLPDCPLLGPIGHLTNIIERERPDRVVVAMAERRGSMPVSALVESCVARGIHVEDAAEFYERLTGKVAIESLSPASIVFSQRFRPSHLGAVFSRVFSVLVAIAGLVSLAPLMALIALAIKLDSEGPIVFVHERAGLHNRPFRLLKFRTMRIARTRSSEWEGDNLDRVTRLGKWLRACRLDELPQFINVLRGEMNLIGPRPHPVSNIALFSLVGRNLSELTGAAVGFYALRGIVRPGITGWAQTRYGYANSLDEEIEKLRYDLYYVKYWSPVLDLRILVDTVKVIVKGCTLGRVAGPACHPQPASSAVPNLSST